MTSPLRLTESAIESHAADLTKFERMLHLWAAQLGFFAEFEDGAEWTTDRALARLADRCPLPPVVDAAFYATTCVLRSLSSALSTREELIGDLKATGNSLADTVDLLKEFESERAGEVATELFFDRAVNCPTIHSVEREARVAAKVKECVGKCKAAIRSLRELVAMLAEERTPTLKALYGSRGGGAEHEFALRLMERGISVEGAVLFRQHVRRPELEANSPMARSRLNERCEALRKEVERSLKRIRREL